MAEKDDDVVSRTGGSFSAADAIAFTAASRSRADSYLDEQIELARLQKQNLVEQNAFELSHLRWRRFNDQMKGAMQIMLVAIGLLIVVGIAEAMWSAAHDNGLVIEAFSVPPDLAQRGLRGEVVANELLDKLTRMQDETNSIRPANTYRNNWGDDIKVEIPDTGISIGELNRYLRTWLGHETHITGEIYHTSAGIAVTARAGDAGETFAGNEPALDSLLQKAAESIYAQTQPYRYAAFLGQMGRDQEAMHAAQRLAAYASPAERAWALSLLGNLYMIYRSPDEALATLRAGVAADPTNAHAWDNLSSAELELDRLEDGFHHTQQALSLYDKGAVAFDPDRVAIIKLQDRALLASVVDDYQAAIGMDEAIRRLPDRNRSQQKAAVDEAEQAALDHDLSRAYFLLAHVHAEGTDEGLNLWFQRVNVAWAARDWRMLSLLVEKSNVAGNTPASMRPLVKGILGRIPASLYAEARAEQGDIAGARTLIAPTPLDCYNCLRMRGKIEVDAKKWGSAAYWFARATRDGPSLPDAFVDWGEMLLHKGDLDGAIAKFALAIRRGPRFADPLERWGEALMAKNRSDLALVKFEEANNYAPKWGRLHLKWGEALYYAGKKNDANKQFAVTSQLELSAADKAALWGWLNHH